MAKTVELTATVTINSEEYKEGEVITVSDELFESLSQEGVVKEPKGK